MNFRPCVNFMPEFEFRAFYNFGPPEMSPVRLTNNVSGRWLSPWAGPTWLITIMGQADPKFNRAGPFRAWPGPGGPNVHL
jgi:hypothetical protein